MANPRGGPLAERDVITMGRASVDLYGQQIGSRLEDIGSFAKSVGGCPANIVIGTARLGLRSALLTQVGSEQMGRFIREQLTREGVSVDGLVTDSERLTADYGYEGWFVVEAEQGPPEKPPAEDGAGRLRGIDARDVGWRLYG